MSDRLALVTGAAGAIGQAVARRLQLRGLTVLAVERSPELAAAAVAGLGPAARPVVCDLDDPASVAGLTARVAGEWAAGLEVVFCNAGVIVPGDVADLDPGDLDLQLGVNLGSVARIVAASAAVLRGRGSGHILATVSLGGILALPGSAAYSASKAGLRAYLAAVHAELRGSGVAVSGIYPSAVDTPMLLHEATHGGSLINFVGTVSSVEEVADLFERALRTRRLELYIPYTDSVLCRLVAAFPWILPPLLPALERIGRRGRDRYLARKGLPSPDRAGTGGAASDREVA